jgi:mannose-1-phosphate guanylyltransferase
MRAVVLVGGEGTRLRPLTLSTPKQMLPIAGLPVIERVVHHLAAHGVDEVVLSLGYRPDAFLAAYPDSRCGDVKLHYALESSPLDTAGAIAFAAHEAGTADQTFLVVNGDVLTEINVTALVDFHRRRGAEATIALTPVEDPSRFGVVPTDAAGRVEAFIEKPPAGQAPTNLINAGIYVLEPSFLDRVPAGRRVSVEREVFPELVRDRSMYALGSDARWTDMGTPEKYLEANLAWAEREGTLVRSSGDGEGGPTAAPRYPGATAYPGATVIDSVVAEGVVIEDGARVEGSLLLDRCRVGAGAVVRRSVLGRNVVVGRDATVDELSVLGDGFMVPDGSALHGVRLPSP